MAKRYIALLRGINVGSNNKINMAELKVLFEENNFNDVITYINSGNIIFSSNVDNEYKIKNICETMIADKFKLNIIAAIISVKALEDSLNNAPTWWDNDKESKHNAIFVIPPATAEDIIKQVGLIKPEYEKVNVCGQVIFWSAPIRTFSKTRWSKIVGTSAYNSITIRNANTIKKLTQIGWEYT